MKTSNHLFPLPHYYRIISFKAMLFLVNYLIQCHPILIFRIYFTSEETINSYDLYCLKSYIHRRFLCIKMDKSYLTYTVTETKKQLFTSSKIIALLSMTTQPTPERILMTFKTYLTGCGIRNLEQQLYY